MPVLEYVYLAGAPGPQMLSRPGWEHLGLEFPRHPRLRQPWRRFPRHIHQRGRLTVAVAVGDLILWRDGLIESRLSGVRIVGDAFRSEVEYKSDAEMERAISWADELIAAATAGITITTIRFNTSKGF
jgi:hypothetical protein